MPRPKRMGRRRRATQTGSGRRIVSTKQDVGMGDEMVECRPWRIPLVSLSYSYIRSRRTYEAFHTIATKFDHL
jgi:hypothetical protein